MGYGSDSGLGHGSNYSTYGTYDDGNDCGSGSLYCTGSGKGYGDGIKEINGKEIYMVDDIPTIFKSIRNNIAKGFIVKNDLQFEPCYIVKENNQFAHGFTLKDAFMSFRKSCTTTAPKRNESKLSRSSFLSTMLSMTTWICSSITTCLPAPVVWAEKLLCQTKGYPLMVRHPFVSSSN